MELRPIHGRSWVRAGQPRRLPATYTRPHGTRQWLAFYDFKKDRLWGYFRIRKRWQEVLQVFKRMRARYPARDRIYLVLDNFSPHRRPEIRRWARKNKVSLVFTPTNASWLNRIEAEFTEPKEFVLSNSNYQSHQQMQREWNAFISYRNKRNSKNKKT
jgi:transposase